MLENSFGKQNLQLLAGDRPHQRQGGGLPYKVLSTKFMSP